MQIDSKSSTELEFDKVKYLIAEKANNERVKKQILQLTPYPDSTKIKNSLAETQEYLNSFESGNAFPNYGALEIEEAFNLLQIENSTLALEQVIHIWKNALATKEIIIYLNKFESYFPKLFRFEKQISTTPELIKLIEKIIDKYGTIKNGASAQLKSIRQDINKQSKLCNEIFSKEMAHFHSLGYLDDIKETIANNIRVLAVNAAYRKKVGGKVLGYSKTGSIAYIEPKQTIQANDDMVVLVEEEKNEIYKILKSLTEEIKEYVPDIAKQYKMLLYLEFTRSKALFAQDINGIVPHINNGKKLELNNAYHPLLYLSNKEKGIKTIPQSIELHPKQRIILISGPNAGGKSITLKTIGLLQLMCQAGIPIPVHRNSSIRFFNKILTDIGDNQSIENQLSTYSYRLKRMGDFLENCDENTLFLIDEFGTGSDPILGGALAECFLEVFYNRESYGVITTHYTNLKLLIETLDEATNACMLFDEKELQPLFQLEVGQAGSSFTFEVARLNNIDERLIKKAKRKIESNTKSYENTLSQLQREKSRLYNTTQKLSDKQEKVDEIRDQLKNALAKSQEKLVSYQKLFDANQRYVNLGKKFDQFADEYYTSKNRKQLQKNIFEVVMMENSKKKPNIKEIKKEKKQLEHIERQITTKVEKIRVQEEIKKKEEPKITITLNIGDRVKLEDGMSVGTIEKIEKNKAFINYGKFTTTANIDQLVKV